MGNQQHSTKATTGTNKNKPFKNPQRPQVESAIRDIVLGIAQKVDQEFQKTPNKIYKQGQYMLKDFISPTKVINQIKYLDFKTNLHHLITHVRVQHQFIWNLCGYYALFNLQESVKCLKAQNQTFKELDLYTEAAFWKFHSEGGRYLDKFAKMNKLKRDKWPWKVEDCYSGDFERTYFNTFKQNKTALQSYYDDYFDKQIYFPPDFLHEFKSIKNCNIILDDLQFNYGKISNTFSETYQIQKHIEWFGQGNAKNVHYVICFMLGVTNHWTSFMAHKINGKVEFYYFDSRNKDYLGVPLQNITKYVQRWNVHRIKEEGKETWLKYEFGIFEQFIKDIKATTTLLMDCLFQKTNLLVFLLVQNMHEILGEFNSKVKFNPVNLGSCQKFKENMHKILNMSTNEFERLFNLINNNWVASNKMDLTNTIIEMPQQTLNLIPQETLITMDTLFTKLYILYEIKMSLDDWEWPHRYGKQLQKVSKKIALSLMKSKLNTTAMEEEF